MSHILLTKAQPIHPKQPNLEGSTIERFGYIPLNSKRMRISNVKHDGKGAGLIVNFIAEGVTGHDAFPLKHQVIDVDIPFYDKNPSFYIVLDQMVGDATEVSFDIEFE